MKYVILVFAAILYFTNPTSGDFQFYIKDKIRTGLAEEDPLVSIIATPLVSDAVAEMTHRSNYYLASKYTIDASALQLFDQDARSKYEFIGVLGNFIPLN